MMLCASFLFWMAIACLHGQAFAQTTLCSGNLRYGGTCLSLKTPCPAGTFEYIPYSNYVGCVRVDQKCCANNPQGPVKNPDGIIVTPPLSCGIGSLELSSRILDGTIAGPCDWPFAVSIRAKINLEGGLTYEETSHACQGVLVDPSWVLTSPACVISAGNTVEEAPSRALVVAGEYNVSGIDLDPVTRTQQEQVIRIERVFFHPLYQFKSQIDIFPYDNTRAINSHGVALIKLAEPIIGRCSGVACLPNAAEASNNCAAYDECVITGWGFTNDQFSDLKDEMMLGQVKISSGVACDFLTQRLNLLDSRPEGTICQNPKNRNTDSCLGDEGGAVLCSNGYNWVVRGILPFNLCRNGRYNLFVTDVASHLDWIQSTMASSGTNARARAR